MTATRTWFDALSRIPRSGPALRKFQGDFAAKIPLFAFVILVMIHSAFAVAKTWDNGGGDNLWNTAANWSPDGVPGSADDVTFNGTSTANCYYNALDPTIKSLTFTTAYTGKFEWGYAQFGKGIRGQYFSDDAYTGNTFSRVDANVNYPSDWSGSMPTGIGNGTTRTIWHGWVLPQHTGTYTFYETSDDGGRLWVNGTQVINQWGDGGMVEYASTGIPLVAGQLVEIKYEMYQGAGASGAELRWSCASPALAKELIPQSRMFPDHNGLWVQWWQGTDMTGTSGVNATPFVNYNWGTGGPNDFFTGGDFSGAFQGFIIPEYSATYTFYSSKDDGVRLYVNDATVIDSWNCCGEPSGTIELVAGVPYYVYMQFRDTGLGGYLNLSWEGGGQAKQVIPVERLYVPYWMAITGNVDLRSGGEINMGAGELKLTGTSPQTFIPKSGTKLARILQWGSGGTTISTNDLSVAYLEARSGTLNLGTGRTVTADYFKTNGGTVNFGTSTLALSQKTISFAGVGSATSGANGSVLAITHNTAGSTLAGTVTGADIDVTWTGTGDATISGVLATGTGTFTKSGAGALTLSGANTFSGGYTHTAGDVIISHNTALGIRHRGDERKRSADAGQRHHRGQSPDHQYQ
jgi:autotransporter-associated beta strand protein